MHADVENLLNTRLRSLENMVCGLTTLQVCTAAYISAASERNNTDTSAWKDGSVIFFI
jgi:hypothetical protein